MQLRFSNCMNHSRDFSTCHHNLRHMQHITPVPVPMPKCVLSDTEIDFLRSQFSPTGLGFLDILAPSPKKKRAILDHRMEVQMYLHFYL